MGKIKITQIMVEPAVIETGALVQLSRGGLPINPYTSPLCETDNKNGSSDGMISSPAAFTVSGLQSLVLNVTLSIEGAALGQYKLSGYKTPVDSVKMPPVFDGPVFEINESNKNDKTLTTAVTPFNDDPGSALTFANIGDEITWCLTFSDDGHVNKLEPIGRFPLEIYTLYDQVDIRFFRKGVPVEILRYLDIVYINSFSLSSDKRSRDAEKKKTPIETFIEYIVKACFYRNPPCYDIYLGAPHFSDLKFDFENQTVSGGIFLDMYLNALNDSFAICNCHDQAAFLYTFLSSVGIGGIDICHMSPFGFLKLSLLVGRGIVNNPFYSGNPEDKIAGRRSPARKIFGQHVFCSWKNKTGGDKPKILDACAGPHIGDKDARSYIDDTIDTIYPPPASPGGNKRGTVRDITQCGVNATVDYIIYPHPKPTPSKRKQFFVVCNWADPRSCPVLDFDWEIVYEKIFAGDIETLKVWKLNKKGESIHIKLYVNSSADSTITTLRFNNIIRNNSYGSDANLYDIGSSYLGKISAQSIIKNTRRVIWVPYFHSRGISNVTFDVMSTNATFNVDALLVWLNQIALTHRTPSIGRYAPKMNKVSYPSKAVKKGSPVTVTMTSNLDILLDFRMLKLKGNGLQLFDHSDNYPQQSYSLLNPRPEMDFFMKFMARETSKNKLRLCAVDKGTLLCNTIDLDIDVI